MRVHQIDEKDKLMLKMDRIWNRIIKGAFHGDFDNVLKDIENVEELISHFKEDLPEEIQDFHIKCLYFKMVIRVYMGIFDNEILRVAQLYGHKRGISNGEFALGLYYGGINELDKALVYINRAIRFSEDNLNDVYDFVYLTDQFYAAILFKTEGGDLKGAKNYLMRLKEIIELKPELGYINYVYRLCKGWLLKNSKRSRDRVMAEDLFKEIIEDDHSHFLIKLRALTGLCELLIVELGLSNDLNIISEIKPLIEKLIGMAQKSGFNYWLIDAYILHGKLALIMFDIESSRRFLTQAERIAEKYGFIGFANEITSLHETIMEKIDLWEQMEKFNAPLSERIELARLNDHLKGKFHTRMLKMERVSEGEVTVYKGSQRCLVCKGSAEGYNIYACPSCNAFYCKTCAQAVTDLENQCWSCNFPIDPSKPVKPYKPKTDVGDIKENKKLKKY